MAEQELRILVEVLGAKEGAKDVEGLSKGVADTGKETKTTTKETSKFKRALSGVAQGFAAYKGVDYVKDAVAWTGSLSKSTAALSRLTGFDAKTATGWLGIAEQRGISTQKLNAGFIQLGKNITNAAKGSKSSADAFKALGVSQSAIAAKNTPQVLAQISDGFAKMPPGAQKAALAQQLFGRSAQQILPVIDKGAAALDAQTGAMAKHIGLTADTSKGLAEMVTKQRELNAIMMGFKVAVASAVIPALTGILKVITPIIDAFVSGMQNSKLFAGAVKGLTVAFIGLIAVVKTIGIGKLAKGGGGLLGMIAAHPILSAIAAVIAGLVLLYVKCEWFRNAVNAVWQAIVAGAQWVAGAFMTVVNFIGDHWKALLAILGGPLLAAIVTLIVNNFDTIKTWAVAAFNAIKDAGVWCWNAIKDVAAFVWPFIQKIIQTALNVAKTAFNAFKAVAVPGFKAVENVVNTLARTIQTVLVGAFNAVKSAIQWIIDNVGKMVGAVSDAVGKVGNVIGDIGGAVKSILPGHQHGGYASSAGATIVGEAGPEAVYLPQGARVSPTVFGGGGGGGMTVTVPVYLNDRQIALAMGSFVADQQAAR